jgi:hypothetical protein
MIALLFATTALAQLSSLNGHQIAGNTGSVAPITPAVAKPASSIPGMPNMPGMPAPVAASPATTAQTQALKPAKVTAAQPQAPATQASKVSTRRNPIPFPGNIPLPPPAGICDVNSQTLITAASTVKQSCATDCSSTCVQAVRDFQKAVFECESTSDVQQKFYRDQLDVKVKAQEAYCGVAAVTTTTTATSESSTSSTTTLSDDTTAGAPMTLTTTSPLRTLTAMPRSSGTIDGPLIWFLTLLLIQ